MPAKPFTKIETKSANRQVYEVLKRAILGGYFVPGERITIRGLAGQLGTSEMPVRESIKRLVAKRAVEETPDRKFQIPVLKHEKVKEILEIRVLLEGRATAQAAALMSDKQLDQLERIHASMVRAIADNDAQGSLEANIRFHFFIYNASKNETLVSIIESLWLQYSPTLTRYTPAMLKLFPLQEQQRYRLMNQERHAKVLAALRDRNPQKAKKHMRGDLSAFMENIERLGHSFDSVFDQTRSVTDYAELSLG